jgi:hypothetical protein
LLQGRDEHRFCQHGPIPEVLSESAADEGERGSCQFQVKAVPVALFLSTSSSS